MPWGSAENVPSCEKPCKMDPIIMTKEPPMMDHRLPNLSLMMGTNGSDAIAPRE